MIVLVDIVFFETITMLVSIIKYKSALQDE